MSTSTNNSQIISFPAGKTYSYIIHTEIHAHPVKKGFPPESPEFAVFRKKGGVMECLFRVLKTVDLNPERMKILSAPSGIKEEEEQRIRNYIAERNENFKFAWKEEYLYRFYILEKICDLNPPVIKSPNLQSYYYCTADDLGVSLP